MAQPKRTAYTFLPDGQGDPTSLTYGDLYRRCCMVASRLPPGDSNVPILLLYPPGLGFVAAFLGTLGAGVIAVPVALPHRLRNSSRLEAIIKDCGAKFAICSTVLADRIANAVRKHGVTVISIDGVDETDNKNLIGTARCSSDVAYLQYTSGSTSAPRGVMVTHGNVLANLEYLAEVGGYTESSVAVSWLPHFHDMGLVSGILLPLYSGFHSVLMSPAAFLRRPVSWLAAITGYRGTHSGAPDFAYRLCTDQITAPQREKLDLSSWKFAFNGAETVRQSTLDAFSESFEASGFSAGALHPAYGLAEATLVVSCRRTSRPITHFAADSCELGHGRVVRATCGVAHARRIVSCGPVGELLNIRIVNPETGRECANKEVGEIWVAGPSVAPGYWHGDTETDATFCATLPGSNQNYLRTGDLGFLIDDEVYITGRQKDLIVIRGRNHYAEDIELIVEDSATSPGACAAFSSDVDGEERLFVVIETDSADLQDLATASRKIREAVAPIHGLEVHAVIGIRRGKLPRTSSGKIQRHMVRSLYSAGALAFTGIDVINRHDLVAASNSSQQSVAGMVACVLGLSGIQMDVPLTAYGLDSLKAVHLSSAIERRWTVTISSADLLDRMTITDIEAAVETQRDTEEHLPPVVARPQAAETPLSVEQERLWFLHNLDPSGSSQNIVTSIRLNGILKVPIVKQSLAELIRRHPMLRASISQSPSRPFQVISQVEAIDWGLAVEKSGTEFELALREWQKPFDLHKPPLIRATLLQTDTDAAVLILVAHHIVADAHSLSILGSEFAVLYNAFLEHRESPLSPATVEYTDFVRWQRQLLDEDVLESDIQYWKNELLIPPDYFRWPVTKQGTPSNSTTVICRNEIPRELVERLRQRCREAGVTLFMWLAAAVAAVIFEDTGRNELCMGIPVTGRPRPELQRIVGMFAYPVILRIAAETPLLFSVLLDRVRSKALAAYAHQNLPFSRVLDLLMARRSGVRGQIIPVMVNLIRANDSEPIGSNMSISEGDAPASTSDVDLFVTFIERDDNLRLWIHSRQAPPGIDQRILTLLTRTANEPAFEVGSHGIHHRPCEPVLTVAATFRANPLAKTLQFWFEKLGTPHTIQFTEHTQMWQVLIDSNSELRQNKSGLNVILLRFEDWDRRRSNAKDLQAHAEACTTDFINALSYAVIASRVAWLVCVAPPSPQYLQALGGLDVHQSLEQLLLVKIDAISGAYMTTSSELMSRYPVPKFYDAFGDQHADSPYTDLFYVSLATMIARRQHTIHHARAKAIVLDCDNTLWGGLCGEDGCNGIRITPAHTLLQRLMLNCRSAGILLCLCSKNNEFDVQQVFAQRNDLILRWDDFAAHRVNWGQKPDNLRSIANELRLDISAFVFVDDDALECAKVQNELPQVLVINIPSDPDRLNSFLPHVWAFDIAKTTADGGRRADFYKDDRQRQAARQEFATVEEFIASLNVRFRIAGVVDAEVERVAELTQRTNQFNVSCRRRSAAEVSALSTLEYQCLIVEVSDRFGDYGIVGVLVFRARTSVLEVDTFLLSCRALGRHIEHQMMQTLHDICRRTCCSFLEIPYVDTSRNGPALEFLQSQMPESICAVNGISMFTFAVSAVALKATERTENNAAIR